MELRMHNFRIGTRIGMALALPIAGLLAFSLWTLAGYYRTAGDMKDVRRMAEFAPNASTLVHSLQRERGLDVRLLHLERLDTLRLCAKVITVGGFVENLLEHQHDRIDPAR